MEATAQAIPLMEQPDIKELFIILENNGLDKEKGEMKLLTDYLDDMGNQFGQVLEELQQVRGQLKEMQDKTLKATVTRTVEKVGTKVQEVKSLLFTVKDNLIKGAKNAVTIFKEKGKEALKKVLGAMKIPSALSFLKIKFHKAMEGMNQESAKIGVIRNELHAAKTHRKNVFRALAGKEIKEPSQPNDRGILSKIEKMFSSVGKLFSHMEKMTDNAIKRLDEMGVKESKKASVKTEIGSMKEKQSTKQKTKNPISRDKEKSNEKG